MLILYVNIWDCKFFETEKRLREEKSLWFFRVFHTIFSNYLKNPNYVKKRNLRNYSRTWNWRKTSSILSAQRKSCKSHCWYYVCYLIFYSSHYSSHKRLSFDAYCGGMIFYRFWNKSILVTKILSTFIYCKMACKKANSRIRMSDSKKICLGNRTRDERTCRNSHNRFWDLRIPDSHTLYHVSCIYVAWEQCLILRVMHDICVSSQKMNLKNSRA